MICGNNIIFGLGTVFCGYGLTKSGDYIMDFYESRLGRYKVGEDRFKEDNDIKLKFSIRIEKREFPHYVIKDILKLRQIPIDQRVLEIGDMIFDFTRGDSDKAIDVVIGWFGNFAELIEDTWEDRIEKEDTE